MKRPNTAFRPVVEALEAREVPAAYYWLGTVPGGGWATIGNWTLDPIDKTPASSIPFGFNDDVYFDGSVSNVSVSGGSMSGYKSLHLVNSYSGAVGIGGMSVQTFEMTSASATLDQVVSTATLMVTSSFTWTAGTLNATSNLATVNISGSAATALIAPSNGGTVNLGSNFTLSNGAIGTMREGTINMINDGLSFIVNSNCLLNVAPNLGNNVIVTGNVDLQGGVLTVANGGTVDVQSEELSLKGRCVNSGTFKIRPGATAEFSGQPTRTAYLQDAGTTFVYGGALLVDLGQGAAGIVLSGGRLVAKESGQTPETMAIVASVKGVHFSGAEISITPASGLYGTLKINGNVTWESGTFKPRVTGYFVAGQTDYGESDRLWVTGTLTFPANTTALIAPVPLDHQGAELIAADRGNYWLVIEADNGILGLATGPQIVDPEFWEYYTGGVPVVTELFVVAK